MSRSILVCPDCNTTVAPKVPNSPAWRGDWYTCPGCRVTMKASNFKSVRDMVVARGAPLGGSGSIAPIGRTALGTGSGTSTGASVSVKTGVSVNAGSTLAVFFHYDLSGGPIDGMTWGGAALTRAATVDDGSATHTLECWLLQNCAGGTGDIVADATTPITLPAWDATIIEATNAATVSLDRTRTGTAVTASPTTSGISATQQANELVLGCVGWDVNAISGTWGNSFTAGQNASSGALSCLEDGFRIVSSIGQYNLSKTGATNTGWAAIVVTLRQA